MWLAIIVAAVVAFVLGAWGYWQYYHGGFATAQTQPSAADVFYYSLRLFVVESEVQPGDPIPLALEVARWLAPLSLSAAAIKTLLNFAREQVELVRCRLQRNHAVVCGVGRQGYQLVGDLMDHDAPLVCIELDHDNPQIGSVRSRGVPVLVGNAADVEILSTAAAKRASFIFAVTGDDKVNIEIAAKAFELRADGARGRSPQLCAVHIDNVEISDLLAEWPLFKTNTEDFEARLFNINRLAARTVIDRCPPDRYQDVHGPDDPPASIMVFGTDRLAQELVTQIARVGHYGNKKNPIVQLLATEGCPVADSVRKRAATLSDFLDLHIDDTLDFELLLNSDPLLEEVAARRSPSVVYVCLSSAVDSLRLVAGLQRVGVTKRADLVVCIPRSTDLTRDAPTPEEPRDFSFTVFDVMRETCTLDNIIREGLDRLARAIHEDYVARQTALGQTQETNSSLVKWNALPEIFKQANRNQADHMAVKLRALGYDWPSNPPPEGFPITDTQLELLAEVEHRRWLAEKKLAGWRHTSGPKDAAKRIAPTIVSWEELTGEEKEKDRDTVRRLPQLLEMKRALEEESG